MESKNFTKSPYAPCHALHTQVTIILASLDQTQCSCTFAQNGSPEPHLPPS